MMQSFKSKYARETFAWMHYYWYLTNDGIDRIPPDLSQLCPQNRRPATLKKSTRPSAAHGWSTRRSLPFRVVRLGLREIGQGLVTEMGTVEVRGGPLGEFGGDKGGAPREFQPSFRVISITPLYHDFVCYVAATCYSSSNEAFDEMS
ncbi:RNA binding Plectin/S10 domain-containing protein [Actinidia rufa]|uniref:RNA binding Plectin/S10 domain-containing protein n=1 Tax=Actinidia rufa TaxID=165716 RepID=A0A7J0G7J4_9ERIC|nr:RNA binding Plectin/S10 domain-containing protein [Actinidia rufa]